MFTDFDKCASLHYYFLSHYCLKLQTTFWSTWYKVTAAGNLPLFPGFTSLSITKVFFFFFPTTDTYLDVIISNKDYFSLSVGPMQWIMNQDLKTNVNWTCRQTYCLSAMPLMQWSDWSHSSDSHSFYGSWTCQDASRIVEHYDGLVQDWSITCDLQWSRHHITWQWSDIHQYFFFTKASLNPSFVQ